MGSILKMLIDMSRRHDLCCRQLGMGHAVHGGGLNMGVVSMCLVRGDQSPRESKTKEAKEKSQDSRKRSPVSRALGRSCKPRTEVSVAFCHSVTGNWGKSSFTGRG